MWNCDCLTNFRTLAKFEEKERKGSFENSSLPAWYVEGREPVSQAGTQMGLVVILDAHSDILSPRSIDNDFDGFEGVVTSQGKNKLFFLVKIISKFNSYLTEL